MKMIKKIFNMTFLFFLINSFGLATEMSEQSSEQLKESRNLLVKMLERKADLESSKIDHDLILAAISIIGISGDESDIIVLFNYLYYSSQSGFVKLSRSEGLPDLPIFKNYPAVKALEKLECIELKQILEWISMDHNPIALTGLIYERWGKSAKTEWKERIRKEKDEGKKRNLEEYLQIFNDNPNYFVHYP